MVSYLCVETIASENIARGLNKPLLANPRAVSSGISLFLFPCGRERTVLTGCSHNGTVLQDCCQ